MSLTQTKFSVLDLKFNTFRIRTHWKNFKVSNPNVKVRFEFYFKKSHRINNTIYKYRKSRLPLTRDMSPGAGAAGGGQSGNGFIQ